MPGSPGPERTGAGVEGSAGRIYVVHEHHLAGRSSVPGESHGAADVGQPPASLDTHLRRRAARPNEHVGEWMTGPAGERSRDRLGLVEAVPAAPACVRRHGYERSEEETGRGAARDLRRHQPRDRHCSARLQGPHDVTADPLVGERGPGALECEPPAPAFSTGGEAVPRRRATAPAARRRKRDQPPPAGRAQRLARELGFPARRAERRHDEAQELPSKCAHDTPIVRAMDMQVPTLLTQLRA